MKRIILVALALVCIVATVLTFGIVSHAAEPDATVVEDGTTYYKYEAENGVLDGQAQNGGTNVGYLGGGGNGTVTITVNSANAGLATIRVSYATYENRSMAVTVNGTPKEFVSLNTGGWDAFVELSFTAELVAGDNTIVVGGVGTGNAPNVDYILVSEVVELSDDPNAAIPNDALDATLTPGEKDYVFYAQTRTNRQNAENKDVRIICVAKQSWLDSIPNFVATFTFSDGTTPVELKSVGLDNVFKSITAYGTDGNIETYTAAEGAVLFGWIVTEVPEAYANVVKNVPKATVVTDEGVEPDVKPGVDYETVVEEKTDINVITDGIYKDVTIYNNGADVRVGGIDFGTSKATYILAGNYEGFYDLTISYTDMDGRRIAVVVNGDVYVVDLPERTGSWDVKDENTAAKVTVTVLMKKGANVISFMRTDGYGPNLVDFDLKRNTTFGTVTNETVKKTAEQYDVLNNVIGKVEDCSYGTKKIGWLDTDHYVTYSLTVPTEGKWMFKLSYLSNDQGRRFAVTVNDTETHVLRIARTASNDDETAMQSTVQYMDLAAGEYTFKIAGDNGNAPNVVAIELVRIAD